jgi:hypothetical protein
LVENLYKANVPDLYGQILYAVTQMLVKPYNLPQKSLAQGKMAAASDRLYSF